jgi:hypothetical protein
VNAAGFFDNVRRVSPSREMNSHPTEKASQELVELCLGYFGDALLVERAEAELHRLLIE